MRFVLLPLLSLLILAGCVETFRSMDDQTAARIARPAFMVERFINIENTRFLLWERMHKHGHSANIYIGADTEINPFALALAARDDSDNLAYISRPCAYYEKSGEECIDVDLNELSGFDVENYHRVLDDIVRRYKLPYINLIGHGVGGNIAAILASERTDVESLRVIAGKFAPAKGMSAMSVAKDLATKPQHHFLGNRDGVVPPDMYHAFRDMMGESECVHFTAVEDAGHTHGWVDKWPQILANAPVHCAYGFHPAPIMKRSFPPPKKHRSLSK